MSILEKIQSLRNKFASFRGTETDVNVIDGWMEEAKRLMLLKSLKEHDGVKYVLDAFVGEIKKINELLNKSYSKDLKDIERDRLLDKRDLAQKFVSLFVDLDTQLERLEEDVDNEI